MSNDSSCGMPSSRVCAISSLTPAHSLMSSSRIPRKPLRLRAIPESVMRLPERLSDSRQKEASGEHNKSKLLSLTTVREGYTALALVLTIFPCLMQHIPLCSGAVTEKLSALRIAAVFLPFFGTSTPFNTQRNTSSLHNEAILVFSSASAVQRSREAISCASSKADPRDSFSTAIRISRFAFLRPERQPLPLCSAHVLPWNEATWN
mmetsp:Transcript_13522/g.22861  ORF Transcript_13522/g.22861 Transcript_13522/m.22861 type:complete len:206 (+) Transcript_13522:1039-1656(+)